jgi:hypothetical protein
MSPRLALALPLVLVLGCAAAPPPAAVTPPAEAPSAAASGEATPASPAAAAVTPMAAAAAKPPADAKDSAGAAPLGRAATDAPISSKITQDDILALVNKNGELFNHCYTLGAGTSKSYRAKVTVKATVSPVGAVNAVEVVTSTAKNPKVDACVTDAFKKLSFTRPSGSGATVFTFPLSFDGIEQVP